MLQFFYDLVNSDYFGILFIVWIIICIAWVSRWQKLFGRISTLIVKPWIFTKDPDPDEPPVYPREFLEQLANSTKQTRGATTEPTNWAGKWARAQRETLFEEKKPLRAFGYIFFLATFIFFVLADLISVANTLQVLQVITEELPDLFQRFDLAVLGGALLATIVGLVVFTEIQSKDSEYTNYSDLQPEQKSLIKGISILVVVFSLIVMVAFAVYRLIIIGVLDSNTTVEIILNTILYGLVPINSALGAAITFSQAFRGLLVLTILIMSVLVSIVPLIAFVADLLWRIGYIIVDVILWFLFSPILAIPVGIGGLWRRASE